MLKSYIINGKEYRYEEGKQPKGAVELIRKAAKPAAVETPVKAEPEAKAEPETKAAPKPSNKARRPKNK